MESTSLDQPVAPAAKSPKALWVAICVLAAAVAALGGALVHKEVSSSASPATVAVAPPVKAPDDFPAPPPAQAVAPPPLAAAAPAPVRAPEIIPPKVAQAYPEAGRPGSAPAPMSAPAPAPIKACSICGHVESVHTVQREQPTTGVGAVAGGVVGGLVGNQIGSGNGRTAATVLGAVGGGFAGNSIEKHVHTKTVYDVSVRMQDGSLRRVETNTAPPIGKAVTLRGNVLQPADGHK
jgi:outer membrane lipoprotein SlyB